MTNPIISLTTDFGLRDGFVGVMKGVMLGICPDAQLVDISHQIDPQNVREAAFVLDRHVWFFPPGSVHIVVVDPGVGTDRRPIAARIGEQYFVAPDNGTLTPMLIRAEENDWPIKIIHANKEEYWLPDISRVFHGRDIFAPVGAHLAGGAALDDMGDRIDNPVHIHWPKPDRVDTGWMGEIIHIDNFGNLLTNIRAQHIGEQKVRMVEVGGEEIMNWVDAFGERQPETLISLMSSHGHVVVAEVNGSAAARLGVQVGDVVSVEFNLESGQPFL